MVAAHARPETVFSVLGQAARRRSALSLSAQLILSSGVGVFILVFAPQWWSLAFLAGWSAAYAAWGLVARVVEARETHPRSLDALLVTIAAAGTALAVAGIIGIGLAFYTGHAGGIKNACGEGSTDKRCRAFAHPTPVSGPLIR